MAPKKETFTLPEACEYIESQISLLFNVNISEKLEYKIVFFALGYGKSLKVHGELIKNAETEYYEFLLNHLLDMTKEFLTYYEDNRDIFDIFNKQ